MNKTIRIVYVFVLLIGTLITTNMADTTPVNSVPEPSKTREIFQPPSDSNISQITGTSTPWVILDLIPTIEEFRKNFFEDLKNSTTVQKIWDIETKSTETRTIYFKILNKFLDDVGHPVPAALANIVSKAASLFDPLTMSAYFEVDALAVAEFFLARDVEIKRDTASSYVDYISKALESADTSNKESVWRALLNGYANFVTSYGFKLGNIIEEKMEIFTSQLIVFHDK